jgi:hypothetical protein
VALDKSIGADPPGAEVEAAGPTAVIVPFASNTMTWSVSIRPDRTSRSLPQRTAPGAAKPKGAASVIASTNNSINKILRIHPPSVPIGLIQSLAAYIQRLAFGQLKAARSCASIK